MKEQLPPSGQEKVLVKPETMGGNQDTGRKEATHRLFRFLLVATATLVKASFV